MTMLKSEKKAMKFRQLDTETDNKGEGVITEAAVQCYLHEYYTEEHCIT